MIPLLLVYLTTAESRAYRRDELAALLWPERPDKVARQNLRTTLSHIRRATADYDGNLLITDYKTVRLNRDLIQSDVAQFSALLAASDRHRHQQQRACSACVGKLEQAIALYRGDFLQGFHVHEYAPLEDWLLLTRELWRQEALQTLASLTSHYEQKQHYQRTITYARQLPTLEPWHEQAQQQLMRALTFSGKRTEALAQYDQYVANLADELAIQPEQETILLYEAIRRIDVAE